MHDNDGPLPITRRATITLTFEPPEPQALPAFVACVRVDGRPVLTLSADRRERVEPLARAWCRNRDARVVDVHAGAQARHPGWLDTVDDAAPRWAHEMTLARLRGERRRDARAA